MKRISKIIISRLKGGWASNQMILATKYHRLYPENKFFKRELKYWRILFWLSGEFTQRFGIDEKRSKRVAACYSSLYTHLPDNTIEFKALQVGDILLNIDNENLISLIAFEYGDIWSSDTYYKYHNNNSRNILQSPEINYLFSSCLEGPYEVESLQLHKDDIVVDCGANMGIFSFLAMKRGAKYVYAFDPMQRAQVLLKENIISNGYEDSIIPIPFGLSEKTCTLSFVEEEINIGGSHITRKGEEKTETCNINCVTLDEWIFENKIPKIDFIKADIEGSERDMLRGARNTIKRDHPRLAICTYHLPDDPKVLRDIILSIDSSYNIEQHAMKLYAW